MTLCNKEKDLDDLTLRITAGITTIDKGMLKRTWPEKEYCLDVLHTMSRMIIEIY